MKREKTLMYRVVKKYDNGEPEILYSTRDEYQAIGSFNAAVENHVKAEVLKNYTEKEIEFGVFNGCNYIYPRMLADDIARQVLTAARSQRYFYAKDGKGLHYAIYIEKMWCIDEIK